VPNPLNIGTGDMQFLQVMVDLTKQIAEEQKKTADNTQKTAGVVTGQTPPVGQPAGYPGAYPPPGYLGYGGGYGPHGYAQPATAKPDPIIERAREGSLTRAFKEAQRDLYERAGTLGNLGMHGMAGTTARLGGMAAGLNDVGFAGAGAALSRGAVPLAVAKGLIDTGATIATAAHDKYSTNEQLGRRLFRELVPGGGWLQEKVDAFSGRSAAMEEERIKAMKNAADVQQRLELSAFRLRNEPYVAGRSALAGAYARGSAVVPNVYDRSTALGEQAYRDERTLLPFRQATARADRESQVATAERVASEKEYFRVKEKGLGLLRQQAELDRGLKNPRLGEGSGELRERAVRRMENLQAELRGHLEQERQARESLNERRNQESAARGEAERAKVREQLLGKAEVLEHRAERAETGARRLGLMTPWDQQRAAFLVEHVTRHGPRSVAPHMLSEALSIAPDAVGKVVENYGAGTDAYRRLNRAAPTDFPLGRPAELRREADELKSQAGKAEYSIEARVAGEVDRVARTLGADIARIFQRFAQQTKNEIETRVLVGRNQ
jgi:hypothetical protein